MRGPAPLVALTLLLAACGGGGDADPTPTAPLADTPASVPTVVDSTATPPPVAIPNTEPAANITLPDGFAAYAIADGIFRPTSLALAPDGTLYVATRHDGVFRLVDADGDGVFEERPRFTEGFDETTGAAFSPDGVLHVSSRGRVTAFSDTDGDTVADASDEIVSGLPNGRHQNNGIAFGPDGRLYITNGSTCDDTASDCPASGERDELSATILVANADGSGLQVYATGLRNPYDLAFTSGGVLWATDNGSDTLCETPDELNLIIDGDDYGWPYGDACDPLSDGTPPVAGLGLHTASTGVTVYEATHFPAAYQGNIFLTLWGSFFAEPELTPGLYRAVIQGRSDSPAGGPPRSALVGPFGSGWSNTIDVLVDRDGTLLVLDYGAETLYRIVYTGD
ncbi:MAG: PQQ-dependent sugar dehydrogenase [Dehalococcoidia bacterium]